MSEQALAPGPCHEKTRATSLSTLPPEILLRIGDHLDAASIGSASLTCKRLQANMSYIWPLLGPLSCDLVRVSLEAIKAWGLRSHLETQRTAFLRVLNTGCSSHYVCVFCQKRKPVAGYVPLEDLQSEDLKNCDAFEHDGQAKYFASSWHNMYHIAIDFHHAHLVLNAHLHGPSAGVPLASLAYAGNWWPAITHARVPLFVAQGYDPIWLTWLHRAITPYIRSDQLILNICRRQVCQPQERRRLRTSGIGQHSVPVCTHMRNRWFTDKIDHELRKLDLILRTDPIQPTEASQPMQHTEPSHPIEPIQTSEPVQRTETIKPPEPIELFELIEADQPRKLVGHNHPVTIIRSPLYQCEACATDFYVNVFDHGEFGVEIAVDGWHNVGFCRTMDELVGADYVDPTLPPHFLPIMGSRLRCRHPSLPKLMYPRDMLSLPVRPVATPAPSTPS